MAVTASAQEPTEWPATTRRRSSTPVSARTDGSAAASATSRSASASASRGGKRELQRETVQELLQRGVAGDHRHLTGGGLVDDLVERLAAARLGRAQERIGAREQRRELVARAAAARSGRGRAAPARRARSPPARPGARARRRSAAGPGSRAARRSRGELPARAPPASCRSPSSVPSGRARPAAAARSGLRGSAGANRSTSIACPIPCTFGERSGNERTVTLSTASASRVARRSSLPACQCVYQSAMRTPSGRASGQARIT